MKNQKNIYRIIDANLNRAREGLRVVEEVARFIWEDEKLSKGLKNLRHKLTKISQENFDQKLLLLCRDSQGDLGAKGMGFYEGKRKDVKNIVQANLRRTEEALRVLEEFGKIIKKGSAEEFKNLRFKLYTLEKEILGSFSE
ncbi:MAG: thiamine-phosphate pyrophosphorylase [candidate division Zixibacteria bacterium]|nr:thiamine-phosphate pyrophosphorylase [candidate division Zixibacteria bacterium]